MVPWTHLSPLPKWIDLFRRFVGLTVVSNRQTHRHIDHATSVAKATSLHSVHAIQPINNKLPQWTDSQKLHWSRPLANTVENIDNEQVCTPKVPHSMGSIGQLGAVDLALPTRRRVNSAQGQLDAGDSARGHFGAASVMVHIARSFVVCRTKRRWSIQRFLDMILELRANMNQDSISCDYEIALFNTASAGFPNAEIFGCFFSILWKTLRSVSTANI